MRFFNTEGPVVQQDHYSVPPLERLDLDDILGLIREKKYFVLHAPRQTGKTSALLALQDLLNGGSEGSYRCVYVNVEAGQTSREDIGWTMKAILNELAMSARWALQDDFVRHAWCCFAHSLVVSGHTGPEGGYCQKEMIRARQASASMPEVPPRQGDRCRRLAGLPGSPTNEREKRTRPVSGAV